jgi:site-specific DNA-cytosine methylase
MFQVLDLFSGIGGFSLGLERAGMETVAFCECAGRKSCKDKPTVGRGLHGVSARMDRIGVLGNAVVPLIPELIGRFIVECTASLSEAI